MLKFINLLLASLFLVLTCYVGYNYVINKHLSLESKKWPQSVATIQSSQIQVAQRGGNVALYVPNVTYQFRVHESLFGGNNVSYPNPRDINQDVADLYTKKYQKGLRVYVSYNPLKPSENCIEQGENSTLNHELYWALGFLAAAMLIMFLNKET